MAEKNEETRSVWDYMEHGVDFEGKETAGELLGAVTGELTQASANLWTANRKQEDLNREILERNESALDIDEFLAAEYQNEESKEYLVEGAVLTCTNSTREIREIWDKVRGKKIKWGVGMMPSEGGPDSMKMYRKLVVTSNQGADVNGLKNATIYDCVAEENIFGFGNCVRYPDSPEEEEILMRYHDEMDSVMIREEGTCPQLMKLESEWENYIIDGEYQTFGDDSQSGITMTSMLFCKHGGFIYPVRSGQEPAVEGFEMFLTEPDVNNPEEVKRYMWYFFRNKGLSVECVSGILGNIVGECNFSMEDAVKNDFYWGLFQWDHKDRKPALEKWAKENKLDINLVSVQCEYAYIEMTNSKFDFLLKSENMHCSYETFLEAQTEEEAAIIFATFFERCYLGGFGNENGQMYYNDIQRKEVRSKGAVDIRLEMEADEKAWFG